jgi:hypothetical protein
MVSSTLVIGANWRCSTTGMLAASGLGQALAAF